MKAIVLHGKQDLRFDPDYPTPTPGPGEVLLRMTYSSICQTDIEMWQHGMFNRRGKPHIQGHEAAGVVVQLGEGVDLPGISVGVRVAVENVRTCATCFFCLKGTAQLCENGRNFGFTDNGGLAEYGVWPAAMCIPLPDNVSNEEAPLAEPTSVAVHAVDNAQVQPGDIAVVIGCGVVGLATLQVLQAVGVNPLPRIGGDRGSGSNHPPANADSDSRVKVIVVDPREQSLALARKLGATETLNPNEVDVGEALRDLTNSYGPDVVIETAGAPGTALNAAEWVRRGGRAVIVGFNHQSQDGINFGRAHMGEKVVMGSSACNTGDYHRAVDFIASGAVNVKPLISGTVPLERGIKDGFERMLKPTKDIYRILVGEG